MGKVFIRTLQQTSCLVYFPHLMGREISVRCSQELTTRSFPETSFSKCHCNVTLLVTLLIPSSVFSSGFIVKLHAVCNSSWVLRVLGICRINVIMYSIIYISLIPFSVAIPAYCHVILYFSLCVSASSLSHTVNAFNA